MSGLQPVMRYAIGSAVVPGDLLGRTVTAATSGSARIQLIAGPGSYLLGAQLFASVAGRLQVTNEPPSPTELSSQTSLATATVSVIPKKGFRAARQVIRQNQTVLARVLRITAQSAVVDVVANQHGLLQHVAAGCVRQEDVKSGVQSGSDRAAAAVLTQCFRPGDWIVARVLSMGDARRYFLSTAEPALGVIFAVSSVSGKPMLPVSWKEMECPESGEKEARKCARPQQMQPAVALAIPNF